MHSCFGASCSRFLPRYYFASSGCTLASGLPAAAFSPDTTLPRAEALLLLGFLQPLSLRILLRLKRTHSCLWTSCSCFNCGYYSGPSGRTLALSFLRPLKHEKCKITVKINMYREFRGELCCEFRGELCCEFCNEFYCGFRNEFYREFCNEFYCEFCNEIYHGFYKEFCLNLRQYK